MTTDTKPREIDLGHGFYLVESFRSTSTGRVCGTRQGWIMRQRDGKRMWRDHTRSGGAWCTSIKDAKEEVARWLAICSGEVSTRNMGDSFLKWLVSVLPAEAVPAQDELDRRTKEKEDKRLRELARSDERRAFLDRVQQALTRAGFNADELERVSVSPLPEL